MTQDPRTANSSASDSDDTENGTSDGPKEAPAPALATALARATTVEGIANALEQFGLPALDACVIVLALLNEDATEFFCPHIAGYPEDVVTAWRRFPANARVPIVEAVQNGRPVLLGSQEQRRAYYPPDLQLPPMVGRALAAVPFRCGDVVGGLGFTFPTDRSFGDVERTALTAVADLCGRSLARVRRGGLGCEVLVVDDEPGVLTMLDFALRAHAFVVRRASGGVAAVEAYRRHRATVAAVLLDVQMPEMDGPQTLSALQQIDPDVRCVFMSGDTGRYSPEELRALGTDHLLQKPFKSVDHLIEILRTTARR